MEEIHSQVLVPKPTTRWYLVALPILTGFFLLGSTIFVWQYVNTEVQRQAEVSFTNDTAVLENAVRNRLIIYESAMNGIRALFGSSDTVERNEFLRYVTSSEILTRSPGLRGIGFIEYVPDSEKQAFLTKVRNDRSMSPSGYPAFDINPPGDRSEYYVFNYAGVASPSAAFGFDYLSNPARANAIRQSVETGNPTATEVITLLGIPTGRRGFLVFLPVYKNNLPISTVSERKAAVKGVIIAGFSGVELFGAILSEQNIPNIDLDMYVSSPRETLSEVNKIYDSNLYQGTPRFTRSIPLAIGGIVLTSRFSATPDYRTGGTQAFLPSIVLVAGVVVSVLISVLMYLLLHSRERALVLAQKMTKQLTASEGRYRLMFETLRDVYYRTDKEGVVQAISPSIIHLLGVTPETVLGMRKDQFYADSQTGKKFEEMLHQKGSVDDYPLAVKNKSGQLVGVSITSHIIFDENQNPIGEEGIVRDVTQRKGFEDELKNRTEELERINKIMSGRELKMVELKEKITSLENQIGIKSS